MKVKALIEALSHLDGNLEVFTGTGDEYLNLLDRESVNVQHIQEGRLIVALQGRGELVILPI